MSMQQGMWRLPRLWSPARKQACLRVWRAVVYTFSLHTLALAAVGCLAVALAERYKIAYKMDATLLATGTTFPLVFTIQQSFTRRDRALSLIANLKASAVAVYWMHRDWAQDEGFPASLGNDHSASAVSCKLLLMELLRDVRAYVTADSPFESYSEQRLVLKRNNVANLMLAQLSLSGASQLSFAAAMSAAERQDPAAASLRRCYRALSRLSVLNERLGLRGGYTKGGEGGMSRANQYLRYIIANLEELRMIKDYRTPCMMRAAHGVLLHVFVVAFAPYWISFCDSGWSFSRDTCPAGYVACLIYCLIVMLLFNVQSDLEQPFDQQGMDDVWCLLDEELEDIACGGCGATTVAASGCSSPRHMPAEAWPWSGLASPTPRTHLELQHTAPWGAAKAAASLTECSRRGSNLGAVPEEVCSAAAAAAAVAAHACGCAGAALAGAAVPDGPLVAAASCAARAAAAAAPQCRPGLLSQQLRARPGEMRSSEPAQPMAGLAASRPSAGSPAGLGSSSSLAGDSAPAEALELQLEGEDAVAAAGAREEAAAAAGEQAAAPGSPASSASSDASLLIKAGMYRSSERFWT